MKICFEQGCVFLFKPGDFPSMHGLTIAKISSADVIFDSRQQAFGGILSRMKIVIIGLSCCV